MNPTKSELLILLEEKFDEVTGSADPLTDTELVACLNGQFDVAKTVSPTKGGVKVVFGYPA